MDVFELHRDLIHDYASYTRSFIRIADERIHEAVEREIQQGEASHPKTPTASATTSVGL